MTEKPRIRSTDEIAKQFQRLAERRRAHLEELQRSGRWQRYYNEQTLAAHMQAAHRTVAMWDDLAGPDPDQRGQSN